MTTTPRTQELTRQRRSDLSSLITYFHDLLDPVLRRIPPQILRYPTYLSSAPFPKGLSHLEPVPPTPIIGLLTATPHALSNFLLDKGFIVRPVVPPTVPVGEERVRVCLRSGIERGTVKKLVQAIEEWTGSQTPQAGKQPILRARL
jgi:8-amino-7-oxononanoate synthase